MPGLSKSKYTNFRKCPKCLWLGAYKPEEQVIDPSTLARFDAGTNVGELAKGLFGSFTNVTTLTDDGHLDIKAMLACTQQCLNDGTDNICEAAFSHNGCYCANDHVVRAVWDEEDSKWRFSATDIVRAINDEEDYTKGRNYWKYLKGKMAKDGVQLVSVTNHFKFMAPDGKQRAADALDAQCVQTLAKNYPNNRASAFLDWFVYSDNTIDGQSKKKAYTLFESDILDSMKPGTVECLQQIHAYLFGGLYNFAA